MKTFKIKHIYNLKLNGSSLFKILLAFIVLIVIILCGIIAYRIYIASINSVNDNIKTNDITTLNTKSVIIKNKKKQERYRIN